jgi:hypothetical protein
MKSAYWFLRYALLAGLGLGLKPTLYHWPIVTPVSKQFSLSQIRKQTASLFVDGPHGHLYWLGCHANGGDYSGPILDPLHDDVEEYFDEFDCHLHTIPARHDDRNLLSLDEQEGTENFSRAATSASDLNGVCAEYPAWGRVRHISLRGMLITLTFKPPNDSSTNSLAHDIPINRFNLEIKVEPDPSVLSSIALTPPFELPPVNPNNHLGPRQCDRAIPAHVPGMVDREYVETHKLGPPFPPVQAIDKSEVISAEQVPEGTPSPQEGPIPLSARVYYMAILDTDGKLAYQFECSDYVGDKKIDRYGILCGLFAAESQIDLLEDGVDPYSRMDRAQILADQLNGKCASYPEWGAVRHFRLRGFELTLKASNAELVRGDFRDHAIKKVKLQVSVRPDSSATSPIAEPSKYIDWSFLPQYKGCDQILVRSP